MNYSITRCTKPPGLIQRALTYYIELNDKGLYLICLGKATVQPIARDPLSQVVANEAVKFFDKRYEKEIQKNEDELKRIGVSEMVKNKNCYFFPVENIAQFRIRILGDRSVEIKLKSSIKRTFICDPAFGRIAANMESLINKK